MRLPTVVLALSFALASCARISIQSTGTIQPISIQISCDDQSITFTATPWVRHINLGDEVTWTLAANSNTQDVTLGKVNNRWPFKNSPPHVTPNTPGRSGQMNHGAHGEHYQYTIEADCQNGTGPKIHGKIDPDMIID